MTSQRFKHIIFNACILLNALLFFLLLFGDSMRLPPVLQVVGRMHPLLLHFPIVLMVLAFAAEAILLRKHQASFREVGDWLLLAAASTAVVVALMGLFLSREEGYDPDAIAFHKWMGAGLSLLAVTWYYLRNRIRRFHFATVATGVSGLLLVILAGHAGADITHGNNFLLAPVTPEKKRPDVLLEDAIAYTHLIRPILEDKCMGCHNSRKAKGELVMETEDLLLRGGKNGALWDTTVAGMGLMMERIHLPMEAKEHMPPKGKTQLTPEEIQALYFWIREGASFTARVADLPETDSLRMVAAGFFKTLENETYDFAPADESVVEQLNSSYRVVKPVALQSPGLTVSFFGAAFFKAEQLKELDPVRNNIVSLNLSRMPVKDEDLQWIAGCSNLRKLNLSFTAITGPGLGALAALPQLRQLSLSGTSVSAKDLGVLKQMDKLGAIYLWDTHVAPGEGTALQRQYPGLRIETGFRADTVTATLNAPLIEGDQQIFADSIAVSLKHYINGVVMRYTLDGSEPDSIASPRYSKPVVLREPGELKVRAFLPGWTSSSTVTRKYYKTGLAADSVQLITQPNPTYRGEGGKSLVDGVKGSMNFRDGKWLGYQDDPLQAEIYFKQPVMLSRVTFSTIVDIGSYIMPALELEVYGGDSPVNLKRLGRIRPTQPSKTAAPYLAGFDCQFPTRKVSVIRVIARPVKSLPAWHPGKGSRGWVFVDEVFLN